MSVPHVLRQAGALGIPCVRHIAAVRTGSLRSWCLELLGGPNFLLGGLIERACIGWRAADLSIVNQ